MNPTPMLAPGESSRVRLVSSFEELANSPFGGEVNALCWPRTLPGDFAAVCTAVSAGDEMQTLDEDTLRSLRLDAAGRQAVDILIEDLGRLRALGLAPVLDCIRAYPRDESGGPVSTDVYSFHADSATGPADTWLCSYTESASEGLRNENAICCVDDPATRAALLKSFGGADDASFVEYLHENCYDLHYIEAPGAQPYSFGLGHLWRIAVDYPGSPVLPCIHRAPETIPGRPPRLLLIS